MKKILTVIGARPQFIKASVVSMAIRKMDSMREIVVHTGQHFDGNMSDIFFDELEIRRPDFTLGIHGGDHGEMTGRMLISLEKIILQEKPNAVMVYGDTNSTLAGALVAAKLNIPVIHVEAGLRSYNMKMPEEVNRKLTDHISSLLFAPSAKGIENLNREGIIGDAVQNVGDVMYDAALYFYGIAEMKSSILQKLGLNEKDYILSTIHRQENTEDTARLSNILLSLSSSEKKVVFPLHPRTRPKIKELGLDKSGKILFIDPVGYLDMMMLERNALTIITDSGGVQKESYFHQIPCITLRDETEWTELIDLGWNRLISPASNNLKDLLNLPIKPGMMGHKPFGEGDASTKIAKSIKSYLVS